MALFPKSFKYLNIALPILVVLLMIEFLFFIRSSINIVSETNKNNFIYTIKVRNTIEQIDKIIERGEVNLDVLVDIIQRTYDINKLHYEEYNISYINNLDLLTESALINSPGISGIWFQPDIKLPYSTFLYTWLMFDNGKVVNLRKKFADKDPSERKLDPKSDPYYFDAIKEKNIIWSNIYTDADTKMKMLSMCKPAYKQGKLIGVVGLDITVNNLKVALVSMQNIFKGSEIYLIDNRGNIILSQLSSDYKLTPESRIFHELMIKKYQNENAMVEYIESGIDKTAIMLDLSNKYNIVITFPNNLIYNGFDKLFNTIYLIFGILTLLVILFFINRNKLAKINDKLEHETRKLRAIIDSTQNAIVIKSLNGVYTDCNSGFLEAIGVKKEDIVGKRDEDIFINKKELELIMKDDNLVKETKQKIESELMLKDKNGTKIYLQKFIIPLLDDNNKLNGLLINAFDITKQKEEQILLQKAKDEAEKTTAMKSNFLANMSHEIRTPLNGVMGFIQLLKDTNLDKEQAEFVSDAQKSSELLIEIINDILDFSKIEAEKLDINNISFDIRSLVEETILLLTSSANKKGLDINFLIFSDVPQKLFGDPGRIKQILNNFISNAIKFTNEGEIIVYIKTIKCDNENATLHFEVKDTGIGIAEDKLNLIFEEFTQADASMTRKYGGTGLGLAISKKLIGLMNGTIHVTSKLGEGSIFTATIPFKIDKTVNESINFSAEALNGAKILLISNNSTDLKIFHYYLDEIHCIITEAHSAQEAMDILKNSKTFSTIIIDYKNQNIGDEEFISVIKSDEKLKHIPIILYTYLARSGDSILAKEKRFSGYLTKPIKKLELIETIAAAINFKNKTQTLVTKHLLGEIKFTKKTKILVVEDNEINCKLISKILNKQGLICDLAMNGKEAVNAYKTQKYDLILMDCQMPILNGYEATEEIRAMEYNSSIHTPIVAMTANALSEDKEKCSKAGMDDYLCKPIIIEKLVNILKKYITIEENSAGNKSNELQVDSENSYITSIIAQMANELEFTKKEAIQLFVEYLEFLPESINQLAATINENNFEELKQIAHKLKGSSSNLRIEKITQLSIELEKAAQDCNNESCTDIIEQIQEYYNYLDKLFLKFNNH